MSVDLDRQLAAYCRHMDEQQGSLSFQDILDRADDVQVVPRPAGRKPSPRRKWIAAVVAAFVIIVTLTGILLLPAPDGTTEPVDQPTTTTTTWPGPIREVTALTETITMETDASGEAAWSWEDPEDAESPWVDITVVKAEPGWRLELSDWPTQNDAVPDGASMSHGMVVDTNRDGVTDYVLGIDAPAPEGPYRVWITDLNTGEIHEQTGPPYGIPFDFSHPGERVEDGPLLSPPFVSMFTVGAAPPDVFTLGANRFYAWTSLTMDGEVVAWDYAPDASWLTIAAPDQSPPLSVPEMEPGARTFTISVENTSGAPAELFVARDTQPIESLVGTAEPSTVAAGSTETVTFTVPEGQDWATFINPIPTRGPLFIAQDIPSDASGELPISIQIGQDGSPLLQILGDPQPGWFGE